MRDDCAAFESEFVIRTPDQLRRVLLKVRAAVGDGILAHEIIASGCDMIGQRSFPELDPVGSGRSCGSRRRCEGFVVHPEHRWMRTFAS